MSDEAWSADGAFDQFWARYPRKCGKFAAKKKWQAAHVTPELFAQIMRALDWQIAEWAARGEPDFIPHPKTWIGQGRWLDEPVTLPPPRAPVSKRTQQHVAAAKAAAAILRGKS